MSRSCNVSRQTLENEEARTGRQRLSEFYDSDRPKTRGDCEKGPRPCPWVGCRHHLFLSPDSKGNLHFPYGRDEGALLEMSETCSLDVAARGGQPLESLAKMYGQSRQNLDQIVGRAMAKLREAAGRMGTGNVGRTFERLRAAYEEWEP